MCHNLKLFENVGSLELLHLPCKKSTHVADVNVRRVWLQSSCFPLFKRADTSGPFNLMAFFFADAFSWSPVENATTSMRADKTFKPSLRW